MKYYLIKANDMKKTEFVGEYYFDLQQEPVELTQEELETLRLNTIEHPQQTDDDKSVLEKIIKVLE